MFQKKNVQVSSTEKFKKEAKNFQAAVAEINAGYKPAELDYALMVGVANKYGVDVEFVAGSFEIFLKRNAIDAIRNIKKGSDYTIIKLEETAENYGFSLEALGIDYFSVE